MRTSSLRLLQYSARCRSASALQQLKSSGLSQHVDISPEVADALHRKLPVVSLETAITTHGLPYGQAISVAKTLEDIIRQRGAVPATIGLIDGKVKIGLNEQEIERLANPDSQCRGKWKVGRRDIAPALVHKVDGGTTVSATSFLSHMAGIDVFVTGGIGGVHRGAQETMDISSDLTELGRTPVAVVCAGAKSILDIGLTLEYLETLGVTVTTFGPTNDFPAFYARKSGFHSPSHVRTAREAAELINYSNIFNAQTGVLIGVPIPEAYEQKSSAIQKAVEDAIRAAEIDGVAKRGKEVTPWILAKVKELTGGESVESNIALIENNAKVGASIAVELASLQSSSSSSGSLPRPAPSGLPSAENRWTKAAAAAQGPARLAIVGAAAIDIVSRPGGPNAHTTAPGTVAFTPGGVSRNVYEAAFKCGVEDAVLVAPVGREEQDPLAHLLRQGLAGFGGREDGLVVMPGRTPTVNMMLDEAGDLLAGVADMSSAEAMTGQQVTDSLEVFKPKIVAFDGNIAVETISDLLRYCSMKSVPSVFEPTSNLKSLRFLQAIPFDRASLTHMAPNIAELRSLYDHLRSLDLFETSAYFRNTLISFQTDEIFRNQIRTRFPEWVTSEGIVQMAVHLLAFVDCLWIKAGRRGLLVIQRLPIGTSTETEWSVAASASCVISPGTQGMLTIQYFSPLKLEKTESVVGAGDSMLGALLAGMVSGLDWTRPADVVKLADIGQRAAVASLSSTSSVGDVSDIRGMLS